MYHGRKRNERTNQKASLSERRHSSKNLHGTCRPDDRCLQNVWRQCFGSGNARSGIQIFYGTQTSVHQRRWTDCRWKRRRSTEIPYLPGTVLPHSGRHACHERPWADQLQSYRWRLEITGRKNYSILGKTFDSSQDHQRNDTRMARLLWIRYLHRIYGTAWSWSYRWFPENLHQRFPGLSERHPGCNG